MVCTTITIAAAAKTLNIPKIVVERSPAGDSPAHDQYGVYLEVHVEGTGKGNLIIDWGTVHSETRTNIIAGNYAYIYVVPSGTHNICAKLSSIV